MDTTALQELMTQDLKIHEQQVQIMRKGNRMMAAATLALAIILACSIVGGWCVIRHMQEQNAATLEMMRQAVIMRI